MIPRIPHNIPASGLFITLFFRRVIRGLEGGALQKASRSLSGRDEFKTWVFSDPTGTPPVSLSCSFLILKFLINSFYFIGMDILPTLMNMYYTHAGQIPLGLGLQVA